MDRPSVLDPQLAKRARAALNFGGDFSAVQPGSARLMRFRRTARSWSLSSPLKPRRLFLPEPVLPTLSPTTGMQAVDEDQLARLGPRRPSLYNSVQRGLADDIPIDPALKSPTGTASASRTATGAATEDSRPFDGESLIIGRRPSTLNLDQVEVLVQRHLAWVNDMYPYGEAFQVLVIPIRAHAQSSLVDVSILYSGQVDCPCENIKVIRRSSVQLPKTPGSSTTEGYNFQMSTVSPGATLPLPESPFNTVKGHRRPNGALHPGQSSVSAGGSIRRGSLMENCSHHISRYVARKLPVLFAVIVQTRVPLDKHGFDIVLPMPYPLAWPDTVRCLQTGLEQLLSEQVKGNIEYLGGTTTPFR